MKKYVIALDQGTTSSRTLIFDRQGTIIALAQEEFPQIFPENGWVEHNPIAIWKSQLSTLKQAVQKSQINPQEIACIGITNQRETTLLWERSTLNPVGPAIVWQDRRTAPMIERLVAAGHGPKMQQLSGLVPDAYFSGSKLAWLLDNIPKARTQAEAGELCFGTVDSFLLAKLTQGTVHATDVSNASRTLLFDIHQQAWSPELLDLFTIPSAVLPKVQASSSFFGTTSILGPEIPITGIAGDQQAATFGQACFTPGQAKITYGTGCFALMNTGDTPKVSTHKLLTTIGWKREEQATQYCLEGSVFIGGSLVQWIRDQLQFIEDAPAIEHLASKAVDTDLVVVPAFTGLGAPHWDAQARGLIIGITRATQQADIARASLEAIALQCYDLIDAMGKDNGAPLTSLRVDGGASANNLLMQMQADLLNVTVVRPTVTETTALGAAFLAGLQTGFWQSEEEIASLWQVDHVFQPTMDSTIRNKKIARWHEAVSRAKSWV